MRFAGQFTPESLLDMIVGYSGERPVYLRDIATASVSLSDRNGFTLRNGAQAYYITVTRGAERLRDGQTVTQS